MVDAARLASPLGDGSILWHPATLADIYDIPNRTLLLFDFYRAGQAAAIQPWTWWRVKDKRSTAHQYMTDWLGKPKFPPRCGAEVTDADLERSNVGRCGRCERLDRGEPEPEATGTVAGVRVGGRQLPDRDQRRR